MTKYLSNFLAKDGIRVNSISPGAFPSKESQKNKVFVSKLERLISLGRIGNPEDLFGIVSLLCSDASSYITGQNIIVDGGFTNLKGIHRDEIQ
jgi:gluconate 5-dehydrogenase